MQTFQISQSRPKQDSKAEKDEFGTWRYREDGGLYFTPKDAKKHTIIRKGRK